MINAASLTASNEMYVAFIIPRGDASPYYNGPVNPEELDALAAEIFYTEHFFSSGHDNHIQKLTEAISQAESLGVVSHDLLNFLTMYVIETYSLGEIDISMEEIDYIVHYMVKNGQRLVSYIPASITASIQAKQMEITNASTRRLDDGIVVYIHYQQTHALPPPMDVVNSRNL